MEGIRMKIVDVYKRQTQNIGRDASLAKVLFFVHEITAFSRARVQQ